MECMDEMVSSERGHIAATRISPRLLRRRRKLDVRSVATGVALFVAVTWTIFFGVGIVLR
jgi:uncharacterized protein (DUF2062 family)